MTKKWKVPIRPALALMFAAVLISACSWTGTPTPSPEEIATSAVQTVLAQLTETAAAGPTATPIPTLTSLPTVTATFGPTVTPFPTLAGNVPPSFGTCNAIYVADVTIPDNTVMTPNQSFTKTWRLQNNGGCTWTTAFKLMFISGEGMGGANTAVSAAVPPTKNVDISIPMTAPNKTGTLTGIWRMMDDKGQYFGSTITVVIQIGGNTATVSPTGPTPTKTKTPAASPTRTATSPAATGTPSMTPLPPTDTETPTLAPTT